MCEGRERNRVRIEDLWRKLWGRKILWFMVLLAIAVLLSYMKMLKLKEGGELTLLSMLPVCLIGYYFGAIPGLVGAFLFGSIKLLIDWPQIEAANRFAECWDYLLGYSLLGFCGVLADRRLRFHLSLPAAFTWAVFLRFIEWAANCFLFYYDSGRSLLWNIFVGAIAYTIGYIGIEWLLCMLVLWIPQGRDAVDFLGRVATESYPEEDYDVF